MNCQILPVTSCESCPISLALALRTQPPLGALLVNLSDPYFAWEPYLKAGSRVWKPHFEMWEPGNLPLPGSFTLQRLGRKTTSQAGFQHKVPKESGLKYEIGEQKQHIVPSTPKSKLVVTILSEIRDTCLKNDCGEAEFQRIPHTVYHSSCWMTVGKD